MNLYDARDELFDFLSESQVEKLEKFIQAMIDKHYEDMPHGDDSQTW
jgi:hypothetical protein